jgi:hypothetical protein
VLSDYVFDTGMEQTTLGAEVGTVVDVLGQDLGLCSGARDTAFKKSVIDAGLCSVQSGSTVLQGLLRFLREHSCSPTPCAQREVRVSTSSTSPATSPSGAGSGEPASDPLAEGIAALAAGIVSQDWWTEIWRPLGTASPIGQDDLSKAIGAQTTIWRRIRDAKSQLLSTTGPEEPFVDIVYGSILALAAERGVSLSQKDRDMIKERVSAYEWRLAGRANYSAFYRPAISIYALDDVDAKYVRDAIYACIEKASASPEMQVDNYVAMFKAAVGWIHVTEEDVDQAICARLICAYTGVSMGKFGDALADGSLTQGIDSLADQKAFLMAALARLPAGYVPPVVESYTGHVTPFDMTEISDDAVKGMSTRLAAYATAQNAAEQVWKYIGQFRAVSGLGVLPAVATVDPEVVDQAVCALGVRAFLGTSMASFGLGLVNGSIMSAVDQLPNAELKAFLRAALRRLPAGYAPPAPSQ